MVRKRRSLVAGSLAVLALVSMLAVLPANAAPASSRSTAVTLSGPVNVNTASAEELDALPGIGPALAQRIIEYRREHGPFKTVDDLLAVKGIGAKMLGKLRDKVTLGTPAQGAK